MEDLKEMIARWKGELLASMEELGKTQKEQKISYGEYQTEFDKRNQLFSRLDEEEEKLGLSK